MIAQATRRDMLGIVASSPIALLPALAVMSGSARADAAASSPLDELIAIARKADAALMQHCEHVQRPAVKLWEAAIETVPHRETRQKLTFSDGGWRPMSTSDAMHVGIARRYVADPTSGASDPEFRNAMHDLAAMADERDHELTSLRERYGIDRIGKTEESLADAFVRAQDAVLSYPVDTIADLAKKAAAMNEWESWELDRIGEQIASDIARVAGKAS